MDKISVIVPVYNCENYLDDCLKSIANQTFKNLEVIMVDDSSTDMSSSIMKKYAKNDSRFIYKRNSKNEGLSVSRNNGMKFSNGNLLFFIDADDALCESCLQTLYNNLKEFNADVAICNFKIFNDNLPNIGNSLRSYAYSNIELMNEISLCDKIQNFAWGKLYKKTLFKNLFFPPHRYFEDVYIIPRALSNATKGVFVDASLYFYRQNPNSISRSLNKKKIVDFFLSMTEKCDFIKENYPFLLKQMNNSLFNIFILRKKNKIKKIEIPSYKHLKLLYKNSIKTASIKDKIKYLIATI